MTTKELHERQTWTLNQKIDHSLGVIDSFIARNNGNVYLAYSGGKDSTILMKLCEIIKRDILCVFVNTGCEYPSIVHFVHKMQDEGHNIKIIRPKITPREVWKQYGFPLVSKEVAEYIHCIRTNPNSIKSQNAFGLRNPDSQFVLSDKWKYLINEPYETSNMCCKKLKKDPSHKFAKENGLFPIVGTMASESKLREKTYIRRGGCNVFGENAQSLPLSIWLEDDIWQFIRENNVEIADIYLNGVRRTGCAACGFGCQFKNDTRLAILRDLYQKYYDMVMKFENNGVTFREAMRKMLKVNGLFLPDENLELKLQFDE